MGRAKPVSCDPVPEPEVRPTPGSSSGWRWTERFQLGRWSPWTWFQSSGCFWIESEMPKGGFHQNTPIHLKLLPIFKCHAVEGTVQDRGSVRASHSAVPCLNPLTAGLKIEYLKTFFFENLSNIILCQIKKWLCYNNHNVRWLPIMGIFFSPTLLSQCNSLWVPK